MDNSIQRGTCTMVKTFPFLFSSVDKADKGMNGLHRQAAKLSGSKSLEQGEKALPQAS